MSTWEKVWRPGVSRHLHAGGSCVWNLLRWEVLLATAEALCWKQKSYCLGQREWGWRG